MTSIDDILEQQTPSKPKESMADKINEIRNLVMSFAFIAMGSLMIWPLTFKADMLLDFSAWQRYSFGGICLFYGCFRIYRVIISRKQASY